MKEILHWRKIKRYIAGQTIIIPQGKTIIANNGTEKVVLIEVQTVAIGEDDIVRIEDDYNRKMKKEK